MNVLKFIFSMALLLGIGFYIYSRADGQWQELSRLKEFPSFNIGAVVLTFLLLQLLYSLRTKVLLEALRRKVSFEECFHLTNTMMLGNQLPLSAGLLANMAYLKKQHLLETSHFTVFAAADSVLKIIAYCLLAIPSLLILSSSDLVGAWILLLSFIALLLSVLLLFCFPNIVPGFLRKWAWFARFQHGWTLLKRRKDVLGKVVFFHFLALFLVSLRFYWIFEGLQESVDFPALVVMSGLVLIIRVASLLPGNIGLREGVVSESVRFFGGNFVVGLGAAALDRALTFLLILGLGLIGLIRMSRFIARG